MGAAQGSCLAGLQKLKELQNQNPKEPPKAKNPLKHTYYKRFHVWPHVKHFDAAAADRAAQYTGEHFWPSGHGHLETPGVSKHTVPFELNEDNLAWKWHHQSHKWATIFTGVSIDDQMNIYLTTFDAIRKFSIDGELQWEMSTMPAQGPSCACLCKGAIISCDSEGYVFSISIETGKKIWNTRVSWMVMGDNGWVHANERVVVACANGWWGNSNVFGLRTSDGTPLWVYTPDACAWNFAITFVPDETFVFQDLIGKTYRLREDTGEVVWAVGGLPGTWCDGNAILADGIVYAVGMLGTTDTKHADANGMLWAYNLSDGSLVWEVRTPMPPNNSPAVGSLSEGAPLSVVMPLGMQTVPGNPTAIHCYDAKSGELQWVLQAPPLRSRWGSGDCAADGEGMRMREQHGCRPCSWPNPWGCPVIAGDGTIYVGNQDGQFFSVRRIDDLKGRAVTVPDYSYNITEKRFWSGIVEAKHGHVEVSFWDVLACFGGSSSAAIAPGVLAFASIDGLYVFKSSTTDAVVDASVPSPEEEEIRSINLGDIDYINLAKNANDFNEIRPWVRAGGLAK